MAERVKLLTMLDRLENQLEGNRLEGFAVELSIQQLDQALVSYSSPLQGQKRQPASVHNLQRRLKIYRRLWNCKAVLETYAHFTRLKVTILENIQARLLEALTK